MQCLDAASFTEYRLVQGFQLAIGQIHVLDGLFDRSIRIARMIFLSAVQECTPRAAAAAYRLNSNGCAGGANGAQRAAGAPGDRLVARP